MESINFRSKHQYAFNSGIEIPITISLGKGAEISLSAKVDSGAASCIFQREYAEQLGIDVEGGEPETFSTAVGSFGAFGHSVTLSCLDFEFESIVYFAGPYNFRRNVLGLQGWFDRLRFGLIHYNQTLFLGRYDNGDFH